MGFVPPDGSVDFGAELLGYDPLFDTRASGLREVRQRSATRPTFSTS
jgi:hypothetical protein